MAIDRVSQGGFPHANLLKTIESGKAKALFVNLKGLDWAIKKVAAPLALGKNIITQFMTDPGGGAFAGLNLRDGSFAKGDFEKFVETSIGPKHQTMTMEYQKLQERYHDSEKKSFESPKDLQFSQKVQAFRNLWNIQQITDGTGRIASVSTINGVNTGASFTIPAGTSVNHQPIYFSIHNSMTYFGSVAHCYEGLVISLVVPSYDENNDGVAELTESDCVVRLLALGFVTTGGGAAAATYWDAFRVQEVDQISGRIYVIGARKTTPGATELQDFETTTKHVDCMWCPAAAGAAVDVYPLLGISYGETQLAAMAAVPNAGFDAVFNPTAIYGVARTTAVYLMHPGYIPAADAESRLCLGLNWTMETDLALVNPYWLTGIRALLDNRFNTVHGMNRMLVRQYLPTHVDNGGNALNLKAFLGLLNRHATRNLKMKAEFSVIPMNPLIYSEILDEAQASRQFNMEDSISFGEGKKMDGITIRYGKNKLVLDPNPEQPLNYIPLLPKNIVRLHGGKIEKVTSDGVSEFLKMKLGSRIFVGQQHRFIVGEMDCIAPRAAAYIDNFTLPA